MISAHAFEHMRQTKEFGLRVLFSVPLGPGRPSFPSPHSANASVPASSSSNSMSALSGGTSAGGGGGGGGAGLDASEVGGSPGTHGAPTLLGSRGPRRRQWGLLLSRVCLWREIGAAAVAGRFGGGRRPAAPARWEDVGIAEEGGGRGRG